MDMIKSVIIERELKPIQMRKICKDSNYHFNIPLDWIRYLKMKKGDAVELRLEEEGFFVKILTEPSGSPTKT